MSFTLLNKYNDTNGNLLALNIKTQEKNLMIVAIYGPNTTDIEFYNTTFNLEKRWNPNHIIYTGDWNVALDQHLDTRNYRNENNIQNRNTVKHYMNTQGLIDIWRKLNPDKKRYTYTHRHTTQQARIDFVLT